MWEFQMYAVVGIILCTVSGSICVPPNEDALAKRFSTQEECDAYVVRSATYLASFLSEDIIDGSGQNGKCQSIGEDI
jgi:hypothetical protein